ncbi:MAG TPA: alpha/beta hydrolase, partial [Ilumatobacter sp.]|nr:alpha/beta hydrolase [Ilumatobacter sp.]
MNAIRFTTVDNGEISIRVAVSGSGPLILCIHGWPELWYSWRHQIAHFAARGFTVAAMDVRGYGGSSKPTEIAAYTLTELTSDAAAVIDALGDGEAIVFGHDWGAPIAWNTARLYASKVRAVAGLAVPYAPVGPVSSLELWKALYPDRFFYQLYIQEPGVVEAEVDVDIAASLRKIYYGASGDGGGRLLGPKPAGSTLLEGLIDPDPFPAWMSADDLQVYVDAFTAGGWHGPFNRYRAQDLDSEQLGQLQDPAPALTQPAVFVAGALDGVRDFVPGIDLFDRAPVACLDFRGSTIVPGVGHWVQQEAPDVVNAALTEFVEGL